MTHRSADYESQVAQRVRDWSGPKELHELNGEFLRRLSATESVDFATALLYRAICESVDHGPFVERINEQLRETLPARAIDATLAIVPGAFYREHPETGADGQRLYEAATALGCRTHVIPTESVGGAAENGRIIRDWLSNNAEGNTILCSLSKGGADVKMALAERDSQSAFRHVVAWINVGSITAGSPMATWVLDRPWLAMIYRALFRLRGQDFRFIENLARRSGSPLDVQVTPPAHLKIIHVLGFPLTCHLHRKRSRRWHRRLAAWGPNDGATILADSFDMPGLIYPVWAADHYLDAEHKPASLLKALLGYLADDLQHFSAKVKATSMAL